MTPDIGEKQWHIETNFIGKESLEVSFTGRWCLDQDLPSVEILRPELSGRLKRLTFRTDLADWDTGFPAFLFNLIRLGADQGIEVEQDGLPEGVRHLLDLASAGSEQKSVRHAGGRENLLARTGAATRIFFSGGPAMLSFLGEIILGLGRLLSGRAQFRRRDLWLEIEVVGPRALLIVSVISFLVGMILAYLGADQLRLFGAQIFIADLVGIGMVREIGALMTGVIIAGRSGSAFAAQLGTMQVNEEIDALRTLGISPIEFLVLPRVLALILMMPLLTLYSAFIGMLAGLLISTTIFDIGMFEYYNQTVRILELKYFMVGLIKGGVYGALIAFAGCLRGMQCGRSAVAVGEAATSAVVTSILLITISASMLTIIFYQLGI
ncbi:MAG: MlaE family ABC transporter permease [Desulfurivibrionaceae bacterium]